MHKKLSGLVNLVDASLDISNDFLIFSFFFQLSWLNYETEMLFFDIHAIVSVTKIDFTKNLK